ncbi:MAG: discoidin domain-containing protein, partial [bacterium]
AEIRATVPARASTGKISVTTSGGTATSTADFAVTPPLPPIIVSFTPIRGPVGTPVTITGNHFIGATEVAFNGIAGGDWTVISNTQIRVSVADGVPPGEGTIRITTLGGSVTGADVFTVTVPPRISSFVPDTAMAGAPVTITGSKFIGATQVAFNGVVANAFTVESDAQILATVPTSATTGKISVTTPEGSALSSSDFVVTALPAVNLALNKLATASRTSGSNAPGRAFDGSSTTYWRSGSSSAGWLRVDLGSAQTVGRAALNWKGSYYARIYQLEVSNNDSSWTTVYSTSSGASGTREIAFAQTTARYIRLYMTKKNGTSYRVNEFGVYSGAAALAKNEADEALEDESIDLTARPEKVVLHQNYPNPFNASTAIAYSIPSWMPITIKVYNLAGQEVATLVDGFHDAGQYRVIFNAAGLPSGNYFVVLKTQPETFVQRLLFVK